MLQTGEGWEGKEGCVYCCPLTRLRLADVFRRSWRWGVELWECGYWVGFLWVSIGLAVAQVAGAWLGGQSGASGLIFSVAVSQHVFLSFASVYLIYFAPSHFMRHC